MKWILRTILALAVLLGLLLIVFRTPDTDVEDMRTKYGGPSSQFVTLSNGQEFHLRDEGPRDGFPIILLHGANSSLHTWDEWVGALAADYRVIRFDHVGHGLTGPAQDRDYGKARYVADVDALADHLGLGRFVLVGHSMGGWISAAYAIEHPQRVAGLALISASGAPRDQEEQRLYLGAVIASIPVLNSVMTVVTPRSLVRSSYEDAVVDPAVITDERVDRYWELLRYPGNRQAAVDRANTDRGGPFKPSDIGALTMPSLIMWGQQDRVTPISGAEWYAQHLPNDTSVRYDEVAHVPMEEVSAISVSDLKEWLLTIK